MRHEYVRVFTGTQSPDPCDIHEAPMVLCAHIDRDIPDGMPMEEAVVYGESYCCGGSTPPATRHWYAASYDEEGESYPNFSLPLEPIGAA